MKIMSFLPETIPVFKGGGAIKGREDEMLSDESITNETKIDKP